MGIAFGAQARKEGKRIWANPGLVWVRTVTDITYESATFGIDKKGNYGPNKTHGLHLRDSPPP